MTTVRSATSSVRHEAEQRPVERSLGLPQSTALVMGSIIGVGIFSLPYALASYGPISLVAMALATVGAVALAFMFAVLSRRMPAEGGPYAYARAAFGNGFGFSQGVALLDHRVGRQRRDRRRLGVLRREVRQQGRQHRLVDRHRPRRPVDPGRRQPDRGAQHGRLPGVDHGAEVHPARDHGDRRACSSSRPATSRRGTPAVTPTSSAIGGAMAICLFSYLGVETAAVAAGKVRDPERNVPRSTIYGTLASAAVYMLSLIAVFGILPASALALDANKASYSDRGQLHRRRHLGGQPGRARRDHLRHRRPERLDDDLRGDAAGRRQGRALPAPVRAAVQSRGAGVRHHLLDRPGLGRRRDQLPGHQRRDGLHHPGPDDRDHRRHPVRRSRRSPSSKWRFHDRRARPHPAARARRLASPSSRSSCRWRSSSTPATAATTGTSCGDRS